MGTNEKIVQSLIVTDAEPLIALDEAGELDELLPHGPAGISVGQDSLRSQFRVLVPDMLVRELVERNAAPVAAWVCQHKMNVKTETYDEYRLLRRAQKQPSLAGRSLRAAGEVLSAEIAKRTWPLTLLLSDADARKPGSLLWGHARLDQLMVSVLSLDGLRQVYFNRRH
jgi:hypothetical protein